MKIKGVADNNHRKAFLVRTLRGTYWFPYARLEVQPKPDDKIVEVYVDPERGREAFTYVLASGKEGSVHIDQVLDYNRDPGYLKDLLLYKLTLEVQERLKTSSLTVREIIRRLGTSATQFYRLTDQTNYTKSIGQLVALLHLLDCDVDLVVKRRTS